MAKDTLYGGVSPGKMYLQSGQFTSTIKTSQAEISGVTGVSYDGNNTPWCSSNADKLLLSSGQFTTTVKVSISTLIWTGFEPTGISWDGSDTPWVNISGNIRMFLVSGQFSSTVKDSLEVGGTDSQPTGISWDGNNTPWCGQQADKLYLESGQFHGLLKTSMATAAMSVNPQGVSYDGTNTLWISNTSDKLYLQSGQFTSTVKDSESISAINPDPRDIDTVDLDGRLGLTVSNMWFPALSVSATGYMPGVGVILPMITVSATSGAMGGVTLPMLTMDAFSFTATSPDTGGIAAFTLPMLTLLSDDVPPATATLTLPLFSVSAISTLHGVVIADLFVTPFLIQTRAYNGSAPECVVMNTKNLAVTEYINYGFNSMVTFNGANLIADQNGIYEQDNSDTDGPDAYKIKAHVKTGRVDVHQGAIHKLRNAWFNYQTDGDVQIVTRADKKCTRYYYMPYRSALGGINERRVKFQRGIRNRFFDFKIQNIEGSQLEIDKLTIMLEPIVSKRR